MSMGKVIYENKECDVISVSTEWEWSYYKGERVRKPSDTWLLISFEGFLMWVMRGECKGIE